RTPQRQGEYDGGEFASPSHHLSVVRLRLPLQFSRLVMACGAKLTRPFFSTLLWPVFERVEHRSYESVRTLIRGKPHSGAFQPAQENTSQSSPIESGVNPSQGTCWHEEQAERSGRTQHIV